MADLLFVGEKPSRTAYERGWTWESGRLAAATLFDALGVAGIDARACRFTNLFGDHPEAAERLQGYADNRLRDLRRQAEKGVHIIALGKKVERMLSDHCVPHIALRHPAARGAGRGRAIYAAHVVEKLGVFGV